MKKLCESCKFITLVNNNLRCSLSPCSQSPGYSSVSVGAVCVHDIDNISDRFKPIEDTLDNLLLKKIELLDSSVSEWRDKYENLLDKLK